MKEVIFKGIVKKYEDHPAYLFHFCKRSNDFLAGGIRNKNISFAKVLRFFNHGSLVEVRIRAVKK